MSRGRRPPRGVRRASEFPSVIVLVACCICLSASGSRVTVSVREREVSGTVHQSVLLAASYTPAPYSLLTLVWRLYSSETPLVKLTRSQCSPHPDGLGYNCSDHLVPSPSYKGRIHLYPDNGSLLLRDLRRSDSGVYVISVYSGGDSSVKDNVTLTVYSETASGSRVAVSVREREVSGTVHQSVLLAASYTPAPYSLLTLMWHLYSSETPLVKLTRLQCSPHPDGPGYNCSDHLVTSPSHKGRIHLYPDNGSLLLRDLRRSDSGVYVISVYSGGDYNVKDNVTLTVYSETGSTDPTSPPTTPDNSTASKHRTVLIVGPVCLAIILITVCLSLLMIRIPRGCRRLDTTERIVLSNGGSREDLNETRNTEQNLQYETIYSTLQFPLDNSPTTTCGPDAHIIYSTPRKVW